MTPEQALQNLDIAVSGVTGTRDVHKALIESVEILKQFIEAHNEKSPTS